MRFAVGTPPTDYRASSRPYQVGLRSFARRFARRRRMAWRTVRSECLDWLLILNDQHLERVLTVFADHYNGHRPHRALALTPPRPTRRPVAPATECGEARVQRRDRLGGVIHEYILAA